MLFQILDPSASTIVNVNIYLRTINDINDYKMVKGTTGEKNGYIFFLRNLLFRSPFVRNGMILV